MHHYLKLLSAKPREHFFFLLHEKQGNGNNFFLIIFFTNNIIYLFFNFLGVMMVLLRLRYMQHSAGSNEGKGCSITSPKIQDIGLIIHFLTHDKCL